MTISITQNSFVGGEWSPALYSRTDLAKYRNSVRLMRNFFPSPQGGAYNRQGLIHVAETKYSSKRAKLIPFQFSVEQAYMLEFGDQYMRVFMNGGHVVEGNKVITNATQAAPVVITSASHGYSNGDWVYITGVLGMVELNGRVFVVANAAASTFELTDTNGNDIDGTGYTPYTSGGVLNRVYEISTPYLETGLPLLKYTQSADVLTLTHPNYEPRELTRTGHTSWTLSTITFGASIAAPTNFTLSVGTGTTNTYAVTAVSTRGEESVVSNTAVGDPGDTFTWDVVSGADYYFIYQQKNGVFGYLGIAATNTFVTETGVDPDMADSPPQAKNPFSGAGNYPGSAAYHDQRLIFARTDNHPQTFWGSIIGSFSNFNTTFPIKQDDAFEFTINSNQVNEIRWLAALNDLIIGTSGSEWKVTGGTATDTITPVSVNIRRQSKWGVAHLHPLLVGNALLFVENAGSIIREMAFSYEVDSYAGRDMTILAFHLFRNLVITDWAYQRSPDSIVWATRNDGIMLGLTYYREHEIFGWHQHQTQGYFENVASLVDDDGVDQVYMIVRRNINGYIKRFVELFGDRIPRNENYHVDSSRIDIADFFFVDCGLTYDDPRIITGVAQFNPLRITVPSHGYVSAEETNFFDISGVGGMIEINKRFKIDIIDVDTLELLDADTENPIDGSSYTAYESGGEIRKAVTIIKGLEHLEGAEVSVLANGNVVRGKTVADGAVTFSPAVSRAHIGLGYVSDLETLDFEYQTRIGTVQTTIRDVKSVVLTLENTRSIWVGPNENRLLEIPFRDDENYGLPTRLFNGEKEYFLEPGTGRNSRVYLRNVDPLPTSVLSIIARMEHGENV